MKRKYTAAVLALLLSLSACAQKQLEPEPTKPAVTASAPKQTAKPAEQKQTADPITGIAMQQTPESTCFSQIGYDSAARILYVTFRESGKYYSYSDVPSSVWKTLSDAKSKGGYFNSGIKGNYDYKKLN